MDTLAALAKFVKRTTGNPGEGDPLNSIFLKSALRDALLVVAFLILLLFAGCGSDNDSDYATPRKPNPQSLYSSAVHDARTVTAAEISRKLTPITVDNPALTWEHNTPGTRVLLLSWIRSSDAKYYDGSVDPACSVGSATCTLKTDLWVTVVPEMKDFFRFSAVQPLRIAQLLGVPPEYALEERHLVELWVSPRDLFRPCPDPEISDRECELGFPIDPFRTFTTTEQVRATEGPGWNIFMNYTGWFNNRKTYLYANPRTYPTSTPYPWTRLGYTYDWGSDNHIGLSEFVVHGRKQDGSGISVGIKSLQKTADYFVP